MLTKIRGGWGLSGGWLLVTADGQAVGQRALAHTRHFWCPWLCPSAVSSLCKPQSGQGPAPQSSWCRAAAVCMPCSCTSAHPLLSAPRTVALCVDRPEPAALALTSGLTSHGPFGKHTLPFCCLKKKRKKLAFPINKWVI